VPADTVLAWEAYFQAEYPGVHIVKFASFISSHVGFVACCCFLLLLN
jgi:hypothetical protein